MTRAVFFLSCILTTVKENVSYSVGGVSFVKNVVKKANITKQY